MGATGTCVYSGFSPSARAGISQPEISFQRRKTHLKLQIGIDGNTYELDVEVVEDDEAPHHPHYGMSYPLVPATVQSVAAPAALAPAAATQETGDEAKLCRSPITGVVIKANVAP